MLSCGRRFGVLAIIFASQLAAAAETLEVSPARVLADESASIRAQGLKPGERVTLRAELTDGAGQRWKSEADFIATPEGAVDPSQQDAVAGSYKGVSAMGLIWSMRPESKRVSVYTAIRGEGPQRIEFQLLRKGQAIATASLEQVFLADGVRPIPVREGPLRGVFFVPAGNDRHPGVLVVGGSNGGLPARPAAWLASHGFAALALAYFRYQDLPPQLEGIPLEYFEQALEWMSRRPEISGTRFGVTGTSRGGELALQLGSMFPRVAAVVAYVPANVRYAACCRQDGAAAWLWQGRPLPYLIPGRRFAAEPDAVIPAERTQGPILMISGEDDHLWRSWEMADEVVSRLKRSHFGYGFENLKYRHAGHSAGRPAIIPAWHGEVRNPTSGRENDLGGSAEGDAESSIDSMPKVLDFWRRALQ